MQNAVRVWSLVTQEASQLGKDEERGKVAGSGPITAIKEGLKNAVHSKKGS